MAAPEKIHYYHDETLPVEIRRAVIALVLGILSAYSLSGWHQLLFLVPGVPALMEAIAIPVLPALLKGIARFFTLDVDPKTWHTPPWSHEFVLTQGLVWSGAIWKFRLARKLDFLLFAGFDFDTLEPINQYTGIFNWTPPLLNTSTNTNWNHLLKWTKQDAGDGKWKLDWLKDKPKLDHPFRWTIMVGPNGVGKSQMAKELARKLAQRKVFGNSEPGKGVGARLRRRVRSIGAWTRRTIPFLRRVDHDPWHVGLVGRTSKGNLAESWDSERVTRIKDWMPTKPTFLILDDPAVGSCGQIIDYLEKHQSQFWYPVRLLIVDQFVPSDLPLEADTGGKGWYLKNNESVPFEPIFFDDIKFNDGAFKRALHAGFWHLGHSDINYKPTLIKDLPALRRDKDRELLVDVLEGNILLLALAALWLAGDPKRTVDTLRAIHDLDAEEEEIYQGEQQNLKTLVRHRLIRHRIEELYNSMAPYETVSTDSFAYRKTRACATIADGLPLSKAVEIFNIKHDQQLLHRFLAIPTDGQVIEYIPPIRPWLIGEEFVRKVAKNNLEGRLEPLIIPAYYANPKSVLSWLKRKGELASAVPRVLQDIEPPPRQEERLEIFLAYAEYTLFEDRGYLAPALLRAKDLDYATAAQALSRLDNIAHRANANPDDRPPPVPAGIPHMTLYCHLAARALRQSSEQPDIDSVISRLRQFLVRRARSVRVDASEKSLLQSAFSDVCEEVVNTISTMADQTQRFDKLMTFTSRVMIEPAVRDLQLSDSDQPVSAPSPNTFGVIGQFKTLWRRWTASDVALESFISDFDAGTAALNLPAEQSAVLRAWARSLVTMCCAAEPTQYDRVDTMVSALDTLANNYLNNESIQEAVAKAWLAVSIIRARLTNEQARAEAAALKVEAITGNPICAANEYIHEAVALAWTQVALARSCLATEIIFTEEAARKVETIAAFPICTANEHIQLALAEAWVHVVRARSRLTMTTAYIESAAVRVDTIAANQIVAASEWVPELVVGAWLIVSFTAKRDKNCASVKSAAHKIEAIAASPICTANTNIQLILANAWANVAYVCARDDIELTKTEAAANKVEAICTQSIGTDNKQFQLVRCDAWHQVAVAWCRIPATRANTELAARKVEAIATNPNLGELDVFQEHLACTWQHVVEAEINNGAAAERISDALHKIKVISNNFPTNVEIGGTLERTSRIAGRLTSASMTQMEDISD